MESFRIDGNSAHNYVIRVDEAPGYSPALASVLLDIDLSDPLERVLEQVERGYLVGLLAAQKGRIQATAAAAGLSRRTLHRRLRRLGVR